MIATDNSYIFYQATKSICDICLKPVDGKIICQDNSIYIKKYCSEHGEQKHILEKDSQYYLKKVLYDKPSTMHKNESSSEKGCPFDCGLCNNHEQHTCIGLIEITNKCNLSCPLCYASSGENGRNLSYNEIERMVDFFIESEGGHAEILQISGGEPTLHPDIIKILHMCKGKDLGYVMLNTNGLRIASDETFVEELSHLTGGFELYLQFDSFKDEVYEKSRGMRLLDIKKKAIENLSKYNIPTTLVCTVQEGINDIEVGDIINFGLNTSCIRGVNFQPAARFGNYENSSQDSLTVSGIISLIEQNTNKILKTNDFVPLPCNVERVAVTYLYKKGDNFIPITRNKNIDKYVPFISNTFLFSIDDSLAKGEAPKFGFCKCLDFLNDFKKVVPKSFFLWSKDERVKYLNQNTFRISITSFIDKYNFDLKSMQKECVHVISTDFKRIPFSAYNMVHRKKYENN